MPRKTGTGNRCNVCSQGRQVRAEVDRLLADSRTLRSVAEAAGVSVQAIIRHRDNCEPMPGVVPPAPMPVANPAFDPAHLLLLAIKMSELNASIAVRNRETNPELASKAASRAASSATQLLAVAAEHHHRREIAERLDRLQAELARRDGIAATGAAARPVDPVEPWDADLALSRALERADRRGRRPN